MSDFFAINAMEIPPKIYTISDQKLFEEGLKYNLSKPSAKNTKRIREWFGRVDKTCPKTSEMPRTGVGIYFD